MKNTNQNLMKENQLIRKQHKDLKNLLTEKKQCKDFTKESQLIKNNFVNFIKNLFNNNIFSFILLIVIANSLTT